MGRPLKKIKFSREDIENMARIGCRDTDIAAIVGMHSSALSRRFAKELVKGRSDRRKRIHEAQWESAIVRGNTVMQIWLGKQELGQTDKSVMDVNQKQRNVNIVVAGSAEADALEKALASEAAKK